MFERALKNLIDKMRAWKSEDRMTADWLKRQCWKKVEIKY